MLFALMFAAYTNHAGLAVSGVPIRLEAQYVALSNAAETVRVPLSIFPPSERRRLGADLGTTRFVPREVRLAVEGHAKAVRRADVRLAKGLIPQEDRDASVIRANAAKKAYLDRAVNDGVITVRERQLLDAQVGDGRRTGD